jgi:DDE family transposase
VAILTVTRAVRAHQRRCDRHAERRQTGDLDRYQEEGASWRLKNAGSNYRPEGCPDKVKVHDFVDAERGKVVPYGVYDIAGNAGCVSVGIDNDTAQFSVNSIRRWLDVMDRERCPDGNDLVITADGGGSNGSRVKLFKLADDIGLTLQVCHYRPGTSKWNKIEHRLFCPDMALFGPARLELRPVGQHDQQRNGSDTVNQQIHHFQRRRVGPVSVLEQHHARRLAAGRFGDVDQS